MRAVPAMLAHACNAVGVARIRRKHIKDDSAEGGRRTETERYVQFLAPSFVLAKPLSPLLDEESVDIADWFERLSPDQESEPKPAPKAKATKTKATKVKAAKTADAGPTHADDAAGDDAEAMGAS